LWSARDQTANQAFRSFLPRGLAHPALEEGHYGREVDGMLHRAEFEEGKAAGLLYRDRTVNPARECQRVSPYREHALRTNDSIFIEYDSDWQSGFVVGFCMNRNANIEGEPVS